MRTDKNGHAWKRQDGTARAVCPFCGTESKVAARGPRGGMTEVYHRIGTSGQWGREDTCGGLLRIGSVIRYRSIRAATVVRVMHAWPPRFECVDAAGRRRIVPVLAYWRARRAS